MSYITQTFKKHSFKEREQSNQCVLILQWKWFGFPLKTGFCNLLDGRIVQTEIKIDFKYEHRMQVIEWLRWKAEKSDKM